MKSDLHLHSTISDGLLTPTELVEKAFEAGIRIMALTDHDSTDGLAEAIATAGNYKDLTLIPGVELSTDTIYGSVRRIAPINCELELRIHLRLIS